MGDDTAHWECFGRIPPEVGPQTDGTTTLERAGLWVGVCRSECEGGTTGGVDLCLLPPEHSHTVHCDQAHYGPVSGGGEASKVTGDQAVVGTGRLELGGDADSGSVGGTDGGGEE